MQDGGGARLLAANARHVLADWGLGGSAEGSRGGGGRGGRGGGAVEKASSAKPLPTRPKVTRIA